MSDGFPYVSVIVPTYRRPQALTACLLALGAQDYPAERFEVIVVDDGGGLPDPDPRHGPLRLRTLHQPNAGPASARNAGAARADGVVLAFTDDDCRPAPDWLRRIVAPVHHDDRTLCGGRTLNALAGDPWATASQLLVDYLYETFNSGRSDGPSFFTSNNMAMTAVRFRELGGFDTRFRRAAGEDRDLCDHWIHAGGTLQYAPDAVVHHYHHMSLRRFWRQHFAYGGGAFRFHQTRARRGQQPVRIEPLSFYLRLLAYPARRHLGLQTPIQMSLMVLSQVANLAGYAAERRRARGEPRSA
jgi:glycosyltransferase involved in cell wall biosynthesis